MSFRQYVTNLDEITKKYGFLIHTGRGKIEVTSNISINLYFDM